MESHSYEELEGNQAEYNSQLEQVGQLLLMDPNNEELQEMYKGLLEVIALTEELLRDARAQHASSSATQPPYPAAASSSGAAAAAAAAAASAATTSNLPLPQAQIVTPPELHLPSILPASVADQIRRARVKSALTGQAPASWAIGAKCEAVYADDGNFYPASVEAVTAEGKFVVVFEGYGNRDEVGLEAVRPPTEAAEVYQGVAAPKRKLVDDSAQVTEIPVWLVIKDTDDEKTKVKKKKLLKSYKSKMRFQEMDLAQKEKQSNWQSFLKGKGSKKKSGFLTGTKKGSMFSVPDAPGAKVGVVGSGQGMTDYHKRARHEHNLDD